MVRQKYILQKYPHLMVRYFWQLCLHLTNVLLLSIKWFWGVLVRATRIFILTINVIYSGYIRLFCYSCSFFLNCVINNNWIRSIILPARNWTFFFNPADHSYSWRALFPNWTHETTMICEIVNLKIVLSVWILVANLVTSRFSYRSGFCDWKWDTNNIIIIWLKKWYKFDSYQKV